MEWDGIQNNSEAKTLCICFYSGAVKAVQIRRSVFVDK